MNIDGGNIKYNKAYETSASLNDIEAFYTSNGYAVSKEGSVLTVTDLNATAINPKAALTTVPESISFRITQEDGKITYEQSS